MAETVSEMLPCPFCGEGSGEFRGPGVAATQDMNEAGEYIEEGREWGILCSSCGASSSLSCQSEAEAITAWNRRPPSPDVGELVEGLRGALSIVHSYALSDDEYAIKDRARALLAKHASKG